MIDELVEAKLAADADFSPCYKAIEIFDELICRILSVKTEIDELDMFHLEQSLSPEVFAEFSRNHDKNNELAYPFIKPVTYPEEPKNIEDFARNLADDGLVEPEVECILEASILDRTLDPQEISQPNSESCAIPATFEILSIGESRFVEASEDVCCSYTTSIEEDREHMVQRVYTLELLPSRKLYVS